MALKPRHGTWTYGADAYTPADAARVLPDKATWYLATNPSAGQRPDLPK
jgi:hypothetical protein